MLVLSRKDGESIQIGDSIVLTVFSIQRGLVRLGIQAPRDVRILRSELMSDTLAPLASTPPSMAP
ncbi:MAG: carbon storage regulator [Isosphaeraceae bacterium]